MKHDWFQWSDDEPSGVKHNRAFVGYSQYPDVGTKSRALVVNFKTGWLTSYPVTKFVKLKKLGVI